MTKYTARRVILLVPQLLAVALVTFIVILLTPGNPARAQLGSQVSPEAVEQLEKELGLDRPPHERFVVYLSNVVRGDFGQSWVSGQEVRTDLLQRAPATLELITLALLCSLLVALPLGVIAALQGRGLAASLSDRASGFYALTAGGIPDFWLALMLIYLLFFQLGVAPAPIGELDPNIEPPPRITGMILVDSIVAGHWTAFTNHVMHLFLPVLTLVFINAAPLLRMTRNSVIANLGAGYVRFGMANGLPTRHVIADALRNAAPPIITLTGVMYAQLIAGAVLTEAIFSWGGVGQYAVQSVLNADWAALQGVVLLAAAFSLVVYLMIDLLHAAVDPRFRA